MKNHPMLSRRFHVCSDLFFVRRLASMVSSLLLLLNFSGICLQAQTPVRITDIFTGSTGSTIANLFADPSGTYLYFTAKPAADDQEWYRLTVADNTFTKISSDFANYGSGIIMRPTFRVNDNVFFAGAKAFNGTNPDLEFNRFNLTTQTFQYVNINPNGNSDSYGGFVEDPNGDVLFLATDASGMMIYRWKKSDNTVTRVNNQTLSNNWYPSQNAGIAYSNGYLYFESYLTNTNCPSASCSVSNNEPVRYRLSDNTYTTWEIAPGSTGAAVRNIRACSGNKIVYDARKASAGARQLFIMDPLNDQDAPFQLTNFTGTTADGDITGYLDDNNGKLYYSADDVNTQRELYVVDLAGKTNTKLTNFATATTVVTPLFVYGNFLYFGARVNGSGSLKKIDRTTNVISDVVAGFNAAPTNATLIGNTVYFTGATADNGSEVWQLNLADESSSRITDINTGSGNSGAGRTVFFPGKVYFTASEATYGLELYTMAVNATLPLSLLAFNGQVVQHTARLEWQTEQEVNTSRFEVEHSADGLRFSTVGKVQAAGSGKKHYSFTHSLISGKNYYRLKMIDKDEKFTHSEVIALLHQQHVSPLKIYPNPVSSKLVVRNITGASTNLRYSIFGPTGSLLLEGTMRSGTADIPVSGLAAGQYTLRLSNGQTVKFVKQ
jgi:ELWxxDGT repeat protein